MYSTRQKNLSELLQRVHTVAAVHINSCKNIAYTHVRTIRVSNGFVYSHLCIKNEEQHKIIVEITINWLPQFRKSIVFESEITKIMFILTI